MHEKVANCEDGDRHRHQKSPYSFLVQLTFTGNHILSKTVLRTIEEKERIKVTSYIVSSGYTHTELLLLNQDES